MSNLWKSLFGLWMIGMGLGVSAPALAATNAAGPYYATPSWDQKLDCTTAANCPRFIVLTNWSSEAVLDRETGLVWEQSPSTSTFNRFEASSHCINLNAGGRTGWRLPTVQELLSLVDRTQTNPALPAAHPFNVQSSLYWSATTGQGNATFAWLVGFLPGVAGQTSEFNTLRAWCVRGGQGPDAQ